MSALALTACGGSTVSVRAERPELQAAPVALTAPCTSPILIPSRKLTKAEAEGLWAGDRAALVTCRDTKSGLIEFYRTRDANITGKGT